MGAFDIDGSLEASEAEFRKNLCPIGIAAARKAKFSEWLGATADALRADDLLANEGVFAVKVEDFGSPLTQLGKWLDQLAELVCRLPLEAEIFSWDGIE